MKRPWRTAKTRVNKPTKFMSKLDRQFNRTRTVLGGRQKGVGK